MRARFPGNIGSRLLLDLHRNQSTIASSRSKQASTSASVPTLIRNLTTTNVLGVELRSHAEALREEMAA